MDSQVDQAKLSLLREETKDLSKAMNHLYNSIVFTCQKKCLGSFSAGALSPEETTCLFRCANESIYLDNFMQEADSAQQLASTQGKPKKAAFFISRRIEDLTNTN
jgi:hypothetical protein